MQSGPYGAGASIAPVLNPTNALSSLHMQVIHQIFTEIFTLSPGAMAAGALCATAGVCAGVYAGRKLHKWYHQSRNQQSPPSSNPGSSSSNGRSEKGRGGAASAVRSTCCGIWCSVGLVFSVPKPIYM